MENNCLVTKFKSTVNNDSLRRYGEMFFKTYQADSPTDQTNCIVIHKLNANDTIYVRVLSGNGNLTDSDLVSNPQKEKSYTGNTTEYIYFSNNDMVIGIRSKYDIDQVSIPDNTDLVIKNWGFDTKELAYANLKDALLRGVVFTGDIAEITKWFGVQNNKICNIQLINDPRNNVYGNINALDGFWLNNFIRAAKFGIPSGVGTALLDIYGDIVSYVNSNIGYTNALSNIFYKLDWTKGTKVTGDLAKLDNRVVFMSGSNNPNSFTWSSRNSGTEILCAENIKFAGDDSIKNYLIDNADLPLSTIGGLLKYITISGTVDLTDADVITAINKLKTKGLSVFSINNQDMLA